MSTRSMAYDHPAYTARITAGGSVGQSGSYRYAAFTSMLLKSVQLAGSIAQATANTYVVYTISQGGTSTATLGTFTATANNMAQTTNITSTTTLSQGDSVTVTGGAADATGIIAVGLELEIVPGATVTS